MNIFLTSFNTKIAASHLDDLRLNKMILETAQLLSGAYKHLFGDHELLYKQTHINHPCSIWSRKNVDTYSWLVDYFNAIAQEKFKRDIFVKGNSSKYHKSYVRLFELFNSKKVNSYLGEIAAGFFDFNCTEFKNGSGVRSAYQKQMIQKWNSDIRPPKWTSYNKLPDFYSKGKGSI